MKVRIHRETSRNLPNLYKWIIEQRLGGIIRRKILLIATKEVVESNNHLLPERKRHIKEGDGRRLYGIHIFLVFSWYSCPRKNWLIHREFQPFGSNNHQSPRGDKSCSRPIYVLYTVSQRYLATLYLYLLPHTYEICLILLLQAWKHPA